MRELQGTDPDEANAIVSKLTTKAFGVFLWVVLACRSLLTGFASFDRPSELQQRIDELPPGPEDLFQQMLLKVETRYRTQASKLLWMCYVNTRMDSSGIRSLRLALFDEHGLDTTRIPAARQCSRATKLAKCKFLESRLRSRCGGLLELHVANSPAIPNPPPVICFCGCEGHDREAGHDFAIDSFVGFMHRTVFEFLDHDETWTLECLRIDDDKFHHVTNVACISLHLARECAWSASRPVRHFIHYVAEIWKLALQATWEPCSRILPMILVLEKPAAARAGRAKAAWTPPTVAVRQVWCIVAHLVCRTSRH